MNVIREAGGKKKEKKRKKKISRETVGIKTTLNIKRRERGREERRGDGSRWTDERKRGENGKKIGTGWRHLKP